MVYLISTDIRKLDSKILKDIRLGKSFEERAIKFLEINLNTNEIWFPAYNYDFSQTRVFNPQTEAVQVGAINSAAVIMPNSIRTLTPIFSYVGFGNSLEPTLKNLYNPFNLGSELEILLNHDATMLFLGTEINSFTFLHYIEEMKNTSYRYAKSISGQIQIGKQSYNTVVEFKARPKNIYFHYDFLKIENDLKQAGAMRKKSPFGENKLIKLSDAFEIVSTKIDNDPFYLLDYKTKLYVSALINQLGRPLLISDFEEKTNDYTG